MESPATSGSRLTDPRLQLSAPNWRDINSLEGRVLSHGEEEDGRRYLMLEGTDGRVYYLRYTPELDEARSRGDLTTNSFVVINKTVDEDRRRRIVVANLGNAQKLFENRDHFRSLAKRLVEHGVNLSDDERWGGLLGSIMKSSARRYTTSATRRPDPETGAGVWSDEVTPPKTREEHRPT